MARPARLYLVCTEASGDLLGAEMLRPLLQERPDLQVRGVAGPKLSQLGMQSLYAVADFNVMGLVEVLASLRRLTAQFRALLQDIMAFKPDLVVLIDAPDFNLRLASALKGKGLPILYYVSPQVWAWRPGRARTIASLCNHMLVLFPFEREIYQPYGLRTTFVGHPLVDQLAEFRPDPSFDQIFPPTGRPRIALAPGSRRSEIERLLPVMAEFAGLAGQEYECLVPLAPSFPLERAQALCGGAKLTFCPGQFRDTIVRCRAAVVASGTATLETGLLGVPMVVGYRLNPLTHFLAARMVRVPHIAMVNLLAGRRVVPELIQGQFQPHHLLEQLRSLVADGPARSAVLQALSLLPEQLGGRGAGKRAAAAVAEALPL
jgi:lipid-A-disaccharide synthase